MNRRSFLKTSLVSVASATLPSATFAGVATASFHTSPAASVMVSGGTITMDGKFTAHVRAAHRTHYGARKKILLFLHASAPADRDSTENRLRDMFAADGFDAESLHHFEGRAALAKIAAAEALFVSGGETFLLLRTLLDTGQLTALRARVLAGVPFHGTSAGANIAGPVIGTTNDFPIVDVPSRTALGVFPTLLNPHHPRTGEPEHAPRVEKIKRYLRLNPTETVLGLASGSIARLHAGHVAILHGPAWLYRDTTVRDLPEAEVAELT